MTTLCSICSIIPDSEVALKEFATTASYGAGC